LGCSRGLERNRLDAQCRGGFDERGRRERMQLKLIRGDWLDHRIANALQPDESGRQFAEAWIDRIQEARFIQRLPGLFG